MLLSMPTLDPSHMSWTAIRHPDAHKRTLHLILATIALKRYHPVWFTPQQPASVQPHIPHTPRYPTIRSPPRSVSGKPAASPGRAPFLRLLPRPQPPVDLQATPIALIASPTRKRDPPHAHRPRSCSRPQHTIHSGPQLS